MARLSLSETFIDELNGIATERIRNRIRNGLGNLVRFPRLGSPIVSSSFVQRYGHNVRKLTVAPYQVIYSYDETRDIVRVITLAYTPSVRS